MIKILSALLFFSISFAKPSSLEVEADNPLLVCDKMKIAENKKDCELKANQENLDWYAATMCGVIKDETLVIKCLNDIEGHKISPVSLKECEKKSKTDDSLYTCISSLKSRSPASIAPAYQKK